MKLGVNIDHIAVLREARKVNDPDIIDALGIVKRAGADQITIHLREDRRHINDNDARIITKLSPLPVNMECSINDEIIDIICKLKPHRATLVPEKREEVTTEGGLDVISNLKKIKDVCKKLKDNEIEVSLFIDSNIEMVAASIETEASFVEIHTGRYANIYAMLYSNLSHTPHSIKELSVSRKELQNKLSLSLQEIENSAKYAAGAGLLVAAGHGLNYQNVNKICNIDLIEELNIGQSIIARSIWTGLEKAVEEMVRIVGFSNSKIQP